MKISQNDSKTYSRCVREINNSSSREMLKTALTYTSLFIRQMQRKGIPTEEMLNTITWIKKGTKNKLGI